MRWRSEYNFSVCAQNAKLLFHTYLGLITWSRNYNQKHMYLSSLIKNLATLLLKQSIERKANSSDREQSKIRKLKRDTIQSPGQNRSLSFLRILLI